MISREVVFSRQAERDLERMYQWIMAAAGERVARGYIERLEDFCFGFDVASERGHRRDDLKPGLRIAGFERRVTLAFTVSDSRVIFLRVFYGGQNWEEAF